MAHFGSKDGPRESDVLEKMGAQFFGCSALELEEDVSYAQLSEQRGEVLPVHVDAAGRPYVIFSSPVPAQPQTFYLEDHGFVLVGEIKKFNPDERVRWLRRSGDLAELRRYLDWNR